MNSDPSSALASTNPSFESLDTSAIPILDETDQTWLETFGVNPSWSSDSRVLAELNAMIALGSVHLDDALPPYVYQDILKARNDFLTFVGIDSKTLESFQQQSRTLVPLDTFVGTQRVMSECELDAVKIINALPAAISLAPNSVREKFQNFTDLGLDAVKIINAMPSAISYAPESVVEKFQNFTDLGLDAVKILNNQPAAIGLAPESIHKKFQNFTDLGLDAVKILNALPPAIGYAPESIHKKFQNFTDLGLDAVKIINAMPSAISYAPESVLRKVRLLQCLAFRLQWQGSVNSLIEASPNLLGFNSRKLVLLGRLAATQASRADRTIEPKVLKSHLIMPLEQYLIALDKQISSNDEPPTMNIKEFYNAAAKLKLNAPDRKEQAKEIARSGRLGRIGAKYLKYAK